ncbi:MULTISPECIES: membrane protein insertion efficiency factor YidD [unclassified Thalassotalea]|uniref:membrane protein insertion efficiency factor YidD n=1 Tax=unclassified Thalassotalea TaxID=2614972 RepID=UPI0010809081|nr:MULTISPECIES: membrane protein insertion efficiency factor YidD [unclassified Thalassotalea]NMP17836.1 membrane protein insertion efficiency factor YidD [Thalassotalea sp. Y01]QBY04416.1 membrane protein insertion efficiency factor YidD [Thalassotalea sp. HSM 43]
MAENKTAAQKLVIAPIIAYQRWLSPMLGNNCRFNPSCSHYAIEAVSRFGVVKGSWLATKRILKCHPLSAGGEDPVPKSKQEN